MSSIPDRRPDDLTARARIVGAALDRFAKHGYAHTTVRQIADDAGASAGLVLHHFGSKEGLRRECDSRVITFLQDKRGQEMPAPRILDEAVATYGPYAARALTEDAESSRELFDMLLRVARDALTDGVHSGSLRASSDPDAQAVAVLVLSLAPFLFTPHVETLAGGDAAAAMARLTVPITEIYTHGLFTSDDVLKATGSLRGER